MRRSGGETVDVEVDGVPGTFTVARDQAGRPVLVDARIGKHGSVLAGLFAAWAEATTAALQAGAPLEQLLPPAERAYAVAPVLHAMSELPADTGEP